MEDSPLAAGIDIGGTHTKLALVDEGGNIVEFQRMSSDAFGDPQPFLDELVRRIQKLREGREECDRYRSFGAWLRRPGAQGTYRMPQYASAAWTRSTRADGG